KERDGRTWLERVSGCGGVFASPTRQRGRASPSLTRRAREHTRRTIPKTTLPLRELAGEFQVDFEDVHEGFATGESGQRLERRIIQNGFRDAADLGRLTLRLRRPRADNSINLSTGVPQSDVRVQPRAGRHHHV